MKIASLETRHYRYPLEPPFVAAWDPEPRRFQDATVAIVRSDDGVEGYASGDALPDRELLERLLVGLEVSDSDAVHGIVETVDFHHGRNWIAEVAVWDLLGRARNEPLWLLLGGTRERMLAYASSGELVTPEERARRCVALRDAGVRAAKLRLHSTDWRSDLPVLEAVRDAVGGELELMVDANQGWRMPGDLTPRWTRTTATEFARQLERLDVFWLEEPLPTADLEGYAELARTTDLRIAAGEMVRSSAEARDLVERGGVHVVQPDVVLAGGVAGARQIAELAAARERWWSPHTWSNGYGLLANLHVALAFSTCPYLEVPFDPAGVDGGATGLAPARDPRDRGRRDDRAARRPRPRRRPRLRRPRAVPDRVMRIRAAVLHEPRSRLVVEEVELAPPRDDEVLVRVAAAGVCHSDVRLADGELGDGRWPLVMGHEGAGRGRGGRRGGDARAPRATTWASASSPPAGSARNAEPSASISASRPARTDRAASSWTAPRASPSPTADRSSTRS